MHDKSNFETNSVYIHEGVYMDAEVGSSNIILTPEQIMCGLYVIETDGGDMICPPAVDIINNLPVNVKKNNISFRFTLSNIHGFNINLATNTGLTFYPSSPFTIHTNKTYEIIFRVVDVSLNLIDVFRLGYT